VRLLVIGAAGKTGGHLVEQALGHGHEVTAFIHTTPLAIEHPQLEVVRGDVRDFDAVSAAVTGHTGVAITIGYGGKPVTGMHEAAAANVVHAMAVSGATRLAAMSASGAFNRTNPNFSLAARAMIAGRSKAYDDLEAMERRIMASDLDWTIVRPVGLSNDDATGHYRVMLDASIPAKHGRIARADVAAVLLKALETDTYRRKTVVVAG